MRPAARGLLLGPRFPGAVAAAPTTDTVGTYSGNGRYFPATSDLRYTIPAALLSAAGTIALRFIPDYDPAAPDVTRYLYAIRTADGSAGMAIAYNAQTLRQWAAVRGAATLSLSSPAAMTARYSPHVLVVRWTQGPTGTFDLMLNNQASVQVPQTQTLASGVTLCVGSYGFAGAAYGAAAWLGPVIIAPERKPDGWTKAISNALGPQFVDAKRIYREFVDAGDRFIAFEGDSLIRQRLEGEGRPFLQKGLVVCDGNSMTYGSANTLGMDYPSQLGRMLPEGWSVYNVGIGGQTTTQMIADGVAQVDAMIHAWHPEHVCVCWEFHNDVLVGGKSKEDAYANLVTYCQARQAAGYKVVIVTILPNSAADYNTKRNWANTQIRANWATFADAIADVAANTDIGDDGDNLGPFYDGGTHPNDAGSTIVAGIVKTAIESLL